MYFEAEWLDRARLALNELIKLNSKQTNEFLSRILEHVNNSKLSILESDLMRALKHMELKIIGLCTRLVMRVIVQLVRTFLNNDYEARKDVRRICKVGVQEHFMKRIRPIMAGLKKVKLLSIMRMRQHFTEVDTQFIEDASLNEKKLLGMMLILEVLQEEPTPISQASLKKFQVFLRMFKKRLREGSGKKHRYPYKNLFNKIHAKEVFRSSISKALHHLQKRRRSVRILRKAFSIEQLVPEFKLLSLLTTNKRRCNFFELLKL